VWLPRKPSSTANLSHPCTRRPARSKIGVRRDRGDIHARAKRSRRLICEDGMGGGEGKMDGILVSPTYSSAERLEISNSSAES
jgi:hypothetical protein